MTRRVLFILIAAASLAGWTRPAEAQTASTPGAMELYPTFEAVGVRLAYTGDSDLDATARLEWRPQGSATWIPGVAMTRITGSRWAGSVMWLAEGTAYEVRAIIDDPDGGGSATGAVTTRSVPPATPTGRDWWVATNGSNANSGTSSSPLATIQEAANRANPGDAIRVRPGIYYQEANITRSGTPGSPIHLIAEGAGVVLDGSDPAYLSRTDWRDDGGGVFSVPWTGTTRLVCADSLQRLYKHASVTSLRNGANGVPQGWAAESGRLYVRLEDGSSPNGHVMHVARYEAALLIQASDWRVVGFETRYYGQTSAGAGIRIRAGNRNVLDGNHAHTIGGKGIYLTNGSSENLIQNNLCRDPRISTWSWNAVKGHEEEQQGISDRSGRGNVIRNNVVRGTFDGIDTGGSTTDENAAADLDITGNVVTDVGDDAIEPETISGINVRVLRNRIDDVYSGMSISPNYIGPMYVLYNTITNYRRGGFKFSISSDGVTWICHNTVTSSVGGTPAVHPSGPYANKRFLNNILVGNGAASVSDDAGESTTGNTFDHDLIHSNYPALFRWKGTNYSTIAALRSGTGFEQNGRAGDPQFVNAAAGDYTLLASSPAIDGGVRLPGINDVFSGAAPDMGAHERGGPDVTPPSAITDLRSN